jgi:hypothetical protein
LTINRTVTIAVVGGALAAWLAGAATTTRPTPRPFVIEPAPIDKRGVELENEIARLRGRLRPTTPPNQPGRDLFTFRSAPPRAAAPALAPAPAVEAPALPRPILPVLKLVGIAEDGTPNGPDRTAIISGEGQLFMVKEGDAVTLRYRVVKIAPEVVELTDLTDNSVRRLALR